MLHRISLQGRLSSAEAFAEERVGARLSEAVETSGLLSKFAARLGLSAADRDAMAAASLGVRRLGRDEYILRYDDRPSCLLILCSGTARAVRSFQDGSQQILAVYVSGDALNPGVVLSSQSRCAIRTLSPATILAIPLTRLQCVMTSCPDIMRALWTETALQSGIQREWIIGLGRRAAHTRLAHFLCELTYRLQLGSGDQRKSADTAQGLAEISLPLTQQDLADTLGLSAVHVNRMLQLLRARRLIDFGRNRLVIRNRKALYALAEFDPEYLVAPSVGEDLPV